MLIDRGFSSLFFHLVTYLFPYKQTPEAISGWIDNNNMRIELNVCIHMLLPQLTTDLYRSSVIVRLGKRKK